MFGKDKDIEDPTPLDIHRSAVAAISAYAESFPNWGKKTPSDRKLLLNILREEVDTIMRLEDKIIEKKDPSNPRISI